MQYRLEGSAFLSPLRDHVLVLRAGAQSVSAYGSTDQIPLPVRLYMGGVSDLRGFGYRTVSPVDAEGDLTGGEATWFSTVEYLYPLGRIVDIAVYFDTGNVSDEGFSFIDEGPVSNWGVGFLIRADNFPVRFDVAFPVNTYSFDTENEKGDARISFSAGYRY